MHYVDAKRILSAKNGMNLYRGCTHGCIYCDSRSKCYNFTHDFEDIEIKQNAPQLLEQALSSKRKKVMISTGSMCDPYLHCEEKIQLTRKCLEIIDKYEFGLTILTKSDRILRDLDLLKSINEKTKCVVQMTLTTYDENICKMVEPNVCTTKRRFEVLEILRENGIPTVVWFTPILPFINDTAENIEGILDYCVRAEVKGVLTFSQMGMTLREGNREYYYEALDRLFPGVKNKTHRKYGYSYELISEHSRELMNIVYRVCKQHGIEYRSDKIFEYLYEFPENKGYEQISLF